MNKELLLKERLPVWQVLSEFFLDTQLSAEDYQAIASILAKSPYSTKEIKEILENEVYPVCYQNLTSAAGSWNEFGEDFMKERILPRLGKKRLLSFLGISPFNKDLYQGHWKVVEEQIKKIRRA